MLTYSVFCPRCDNDSKLEPRENCRTRSHSMVLGSSSSRGLCDAWYLITLLGLVHGSLTFCLPTRPDSELETTERCARTAGASSTRSYASVGERVVVCCCALHSLVRRLGCKYQAAELHLVLSPSSWHIVVGCVSGVGSLASGCRSSLVIPILTDYQGASWAKAASHYLHVGTHTMQEPLHRMTYLL